MYNIPMFPNLREVLDINEVKNSLAICKDEALSFIVWRNNSNTRLTLEAIVTNFFISKNVLAVLEVDDTSNLDLNETVYIYQENLKLLFKGVLVKKDKKTFNLQLESKLFLEEKRKISRFVFEKILFDGYFEVFNELLDKTKKFKAEIKNISNTGYSYIISANRGNLFSVDSQIKLTQIEKVSFPEPLEGTIKHISPKKDNFGQTELHIGVLFDIESEILNEVFSQMNVK
jgi:hypothetical protein